MSGRLATRSRPATGSLIAQNAMIKSQLLRFSPLLALLMAAACTTIPTGPSVMALPGTGRSFDQFRASDAECRQFALSQSGGTTANQTAIDSGMKSAAVGAAVGALAGAAMGGRDSAGVGAGTGLLVGSLAGASAGESSGRDLQRRYDSAYLQCMYAKGERVPVSGRLISEPPRVSSPPPNSTVPPPPPQGHPPPPPPGVSR